MTWEDQAACKGGPFNLFIYHDADSPAAAGLKAGERLDMNEANAHEAAEICVECPVMLACLEQATPPERQWTVRGGEPPKRLIVERQRFERRAKAGLPTRFQVAAPGDRVCQRNHYIKGGGRCRLCKNMATARWQRKSRAAIRQAQGSVEQ